MFSPHQQQMQYVKSVPDSGILTFIANQNPLFNIFVLGDIQSFLANTPASAGHPQQSVDNYKNYMINDAKLGPAHGVQDLAPQSPQGRMKVEPADFYSIFVRYTVHPKLESFMAPCIKHDPLFNVDDLFSSLFGSIKA